MRSLLLIAAVCSVVALAAPAQARSGGVGLGLTVGDPTGLTVKFPLSGNTAIDAAIGADTVDRGDDGQLHVDWLIAPAILGRGNGVTVPLYFGIGGVLEFDGNRRNDDDIDLGVRAPLGIAIELSRTPLEFFFELGLEVIVVDAGRDDDNFDLDGALGVRFYL
jgi:hypothetical protein